MTYFRNDIRNFIFRRQMDDEEFEAREEAFVARFGGREPAGHTHDEEAHEEEAHEEELAIVEFLGSDARLQGIEAHADVRLTSRLSAEVGVDYVHGQLTNEGLPLPRIPPLRGRVGLRYQVNAFQVGGEVTGHHDAASCVRRRGADRGISAPQAVCVVLVRDGPDDQHGHGEARQRDRRAVPESSVAHQGARAGKGAQRHASLQRAFLSIPGRPHGLEGPRSALSVS